MAGSPVLDQPRRQAELGISCFHQEALRWNIKLLPWTEHFKHYDNVCLNWFSLSLCSLNFEYLSFFSLYNNSRVLTRSGPDSNDNKRRTCVYMHGGELVCGRVMRGQNAEWCVFVGGGAPERGAGVTSCEAHQDSPTKPGPENKGPILEVLVQDGS